MLNQLCSNDIISKLEKEIFNNLKTLRHKSAHPSGHFPTAEEARYVYSEIITKVLSQPLLKTKDLVQGILKKLDNTNYFPTTNLEDIKIIVEDEIKNLHEEAIPMLISKLNLEIKDTSIGEKNNHKFFLCGLALLNKNQITKKIYDIFVKNNLDKLNLRRTITALFTNENRMLEFIKDDNISIQRLNSMIIDKIENDTLTGNAVHTEYSFYRENSMLINEFSLYEKFKLSIEKMFTYNKYSFPKELLIFSELKSLVIQNYKDFAKSSMFITSNEFAEKYVNIDSFLILEPEDAFKICKNIKTAADSRSFTSKSYYNNHYKDYPNLKNKAKEYLESLEDTSLINDDLILKINEEETPSPDIDDNNEVDG